MNALNLNPNDPRWLNLIKKDPTATIFHHPAWMELLSASYGYHPFIYATADQNGQLCAGLPIAEIHNYLTPRRWVALPFSDYCAPLCQDEESKAQLAIGLIGQQQAKRCPRIEIRTSLPAQANLQMSSPFVLHTIPLQADFASVAKRVNRTQMQNVRTAEKNDIRILRGTSLAEVRAFYQLHSLSRRRQGVPVQPWNFFKQMTKLLLEQGMGFVLLGYKGDQCISAGLFLHWQRTLTYKYSAIDDNHLHERPNHLVTWTAIKWGCENGFTTFDFGRADREDEGLCMYKRRWGADEAPLFYSYIPSAPGAESSTKKRLALWFHEVIRRSPVLVCQAIGEILYRYAG